MKTNHSASSLLSFAVLVCALASVTRGAEILSIGNKKDLQLGGNYLGNVMSTYQ